MTRVAFLFPVTQRSLLSHTLPKTHLLGCMTLQREPATTFKSTVSTFRIENISSLIWMVFQWHVYKQGPAEAPGRRQAQEVWTEVTAANPKECPHLGVCKRPKPAQWPRRATHPRLFPCPHSQPLSYTGFALLSLQSLQLKVHLCTWRWQVCLPLLRESRDSVLVPWLP